MPPTSSLASHIDNLRNRRRSALSLAAASGIVWAFSYPGFDIWPLAGIAFIPLLLVIEGQSSRTAFYRGWMSGFAANFMGHYWLIEMLRKFSGFPTVLCIVFAAAITAWQGLLTGCAAWLYVRLRTWKLSMVGAFVIAWIVAEQWFPVLFQNYFGATLYQVPPLLQIADLGGPTLISGLLVAVNATLAALIFGAARLAPLPKYALAVCAIALASTLGYGAFRISQQQQAISTAPKIKVGLVQANMGIYAKRQDPMEGLRRHVEQTRQIEQEIHPDLIIWPESAVVYFLSPAMTNVRRALLPGITTPVLFGGLFVEPNKDPPRHYNTAFMTDAQGVIRGHYHKTYLLAFGEYLPFGETFPALYDMSPHSGRFTPGTTTPALPLGPYRIGALICYEDILPNFVRGLMKQSRPHLLVNITNDAWFGDTTEPWTHLALSTLRAVEQHRYLARSTNSGVSAIIDPLGRVVSHTAVFKRDNLVGEVAMLEGTTLYQIVGDWPAYIALIALIAFGLATYVRRRPQRPEVL